MKTFKDLVFTDHELSVQAQEMKKLGINSMNNWLSAKHATITFDNGRELSVVFGKVFYSNGMDTYEAMELGLDEPLGYLSEDEVTKVMEEMQK